MSELRISELAAGCREANRRYQRGESGGEDYCFELFRRAVCDRDQAAWEAVIEQYHRVVLGWLRRHRALGAAREDEAYWVNRSFERFWSAVGADRFGGFPDLRALLGYLKMCVNSVLMDEARAQAVPRIEPLPEAATDDRDTANVETLVVGAVSGRELWETILAELPDETERLVAYLSLALDLKPREIYDRYPDRYASVGEVYRVKRNILDRLRRSAAIRAFTT